MADPLTPRYTSGSMGFKTLFALALSGCGILRLGSAPAEGTESEGKDHAAILQFAATVEREISERTSHAAPPREEYLG